MFKFSLESNEKYTCLVKLFLGKLRESIFLNIFLKKAKHKVSHHIQSQLIHSLEMHTQ